MTRLARGLVAVVAVETAVGALLFDVLLEDTAREHIHNPAWPPHAKFHDAQYIVMSLALGLLSLALIASRRGDARSRLLWAAGILAVPWASMFPALLFPGTAMSDPEFTGETRFVLGLHAQLFLAVVTLVLLGVAAVLAADRRQRTS